MERQVIFVIKFNRMDKFIAQNKHDIAKSAGNVWEFTIKDPGGRLNKKDGLTRYGNSRVKDKTS